MPAERATTAHFGGHMSKPPLPEAARAMLRKPNPAVITTLRPDGQPVSTATWYLWDDGRRAGEHGRGAEAAGAYAQRSPGRPRRPRRKRLVHPSQHHRTRR